MKVGDRVKTSRICWSGEWRMIFKVWRWAAIYVHLTSAGLVGIESSQNIYVPTESGLSSAVAAACTVPPPDFPLPLCMYETNRTFIATCRKTLLSIAQSFYSYSLVYCNVLRNWFWRLQGPNDAVLSNLIPRHFRITLRETSTSLPPEGSVRSIGVIGNMFHVDTQARVCSLGMCSFRYSWLFYRNFCCGGVVLYLVKWLVAVASDTFFLSSEFMRS